MVWRESLLTEGHPDHAEWNKAPGSELSKFRLIDQLLYGRNHLSESVMKSIQDTGRAVIVSRPGMDEDNSYESEEDSQVDGGAHN